MKLKLEENQKFGRWSLDEYAGNGKWNCTCLCGNSKTVLTNVLTSGRSTSCGCYQKEAASKRLSSHGKTKHRVYALWAGMKRRCYNIRDSAYPRYGARGIITSDEWLSFDSFYRDMGDPPTWSHSIDRIDNSKGYSKENCRWATQKEQARNKSSNRFFTFNGKNQCMADWAKDLGITSGALFRRLEIWPVEKALSLKKQLGYGMPPARLIEFNGSTKTLKEWSELIGIDTVSMTKRLKKWSLEKALTTAPQIQYIRNKKC